MLVLRGVFYNFLLFLSLNMVRGGMMKTKCLRTKVFICLVAIKKKGMRMLALSGMPCLAVCVIFR